MTPQSTHKVVIAIMLEKLAQPSPFHYIYHHIQICGVRSSWEGRYTPPISTLHQYSMYGTDI
jgi:hypothetical protein